jgi:hypothetical protein
MQYGTDSVKGLGGLLQVAGQFVFGKDFFERFGMPKLLV